MLFAMMSNRPVLAVFLTGQDTVTLREGHTLFIRPEQTAGAYFNEILISQHKTKDEVVALIRQLDPSAVIPEHMDPPAPYEGEMRCEGCEGVTSPAYAFEGRCIVCWANEAKRFRAQSN